jgi:hypothetical protein
MKRGKIMLSALGVLAVIGSALAFKANEAYNGTLRCSALTTDAATTATIAATNCTQTTRYIATNAAAAPFRYCTAALTAVTEPCYATTKVTLNP